MPFLQRSLIRGGQQALIVADQRLFQPAGDAFRIPVIRFRIRIAICGCQGKATEERISGFYLEIVGIRTAIQVVETDSMRIAIHIHNYLFPEIRIVPLSVQSQLLSEQRYVKRKVHTRIPGLFLVQVGSYIHFAATGQKIIVFSQHIRRPESLPGRSTHMEPVERIIFYMQAGRHKEIVQRAVIRP